MGEFEKASKIERRKTALAQRREEGGGGRVAPSIFFILSVSLFLSFFLPHDTTNNNNEKQQPRTGSGPIELGPIGMTVGASSDGPAQAKVEEESSSAASTSGGGGSSGSSKKASSRLSALSTEEWRAKYEPDGCVDLWVEEEFNAGSRLVGGRAAHLLGPAAAGAGSGEGRVLERKAPVATHTVKIFHKATAQTVEVAVPEDRYVLWVSSFLFVLF